MFSAVSLKNEFVLLGAVLFILFKHLMYIRTKMLYIVFP